MLLCFRYARFGLPFYVLNTLLCRRYQVVTDPRFGRYEESFGEVGGQQGPAGASDPHALPSHNVMQDPFLVSTMGSAMVQGQQGPPASPALSTPSSYIEGAANVACEAKHAVAYGFGGRDWYRADVNGARGGDVCGVLCVCVHAYPLPPSPAS